MRTFTCLCGNTLFFDNTACTRCARSAGWCEGCAAVVGVDPVAGSSPAQYTCPAGHVLSACANHVQFDVCNRFRVEGPGLCKACVLNRTVPDQQVPGNRAKWARLEAAKRRMLYDLTQVGCGLDRIRSLGAGRTALQFDFMADKVPGGNWRAMDDGEPVYTGHDGGVITINLKETDSVEREKARVNLGEPQRTLVGHFRHEIGHYLWDLLIQDEPAPFARFVEVFGDPFNPDYGDALERHYEQGPPADWRSHYVSAYATMHPWEDWAETWHAYLRLVGVLETMRTHGLGGVAEPLANLDASIHAFAGASIALNELSRDSGLVPLIAENLNDTVKVKLACVHELVRPKTDPAGIA